MVPTRLILNMGVCKAHQEWSRPPDIYFCQNSLMSKLKIWCQHTNHIVHCFSFSSFILTLFLYLTILEFVEHVLCKSHLSVIIAVRLLLLNLNFGHIIGIYPGFYRFLSNRYKENGAHLLIKWPKIKNKVTFAFL